MKIYQDSPAKTEYDTMSYLSKGHYDVLVSGAKTTLPRRHSVKEARQLLFLNLVFSAMRVLSERRFLWKWFRLLL